MKRSLMAITLSSLFPLISFGNIISPPSAQATHKCKIEAYTPFQHCLLGRPDSGNTR